MNTTSDHRSRQAQGIGMVDGDVVMFAHEHIKTESQRGQLNNGRGPGQQNRNTADEQNTRQKQDQEGGVSLPYSDLPAKQ